MGPVSSAISGVSSILSGALGYAYNKKLMQAQQAYNTSERLANAFSSFQ